MSAAEEAKREQRRKEIEAQKNTKVAIRAATSGSADTREAQLKTGFVKSTLAAQGITLSQLKQPTKSKDNPLFIYPGDTFVDLGTKRGAPKRVTVQRGFIRRLTEFYQKMENAPTIFNRQCNFQFQPDTIVRTVAANAYDTQFFFNQEPSQLSVPIPGQATYSFKLLFNREAELVSRKYRTASGLQSVDVRTINNRLRSSPDYFIQNEYDPSWVCGLGVLADIMVLDAVVGQGFNDEMLTIVQNTLISRQNQPQVSQENTDDEDKENTEAATTPSWNWTNESLNPNLGNTAFLTPVPVRVVLSKWMMIEGFVTSVNVNFHKFTKNYIPSQASVEVTMQALYMGFEKQETMLTQKVPVSETTASGNPDNEGPVEQDKAIRDQTQQVLDSFFITARDQGMSFFGLQDRDSLNDIVFTNSEQLFDFNISFKQSSETTKWLDEVEGNKNDVEGQLKFSYEAVIKLHWYKYAAGANQNDSGTQRVTYKGRSSPAGSTITKIDHNKFPSELEYLKEWGTEKNPFLIKSSGAMRKANSSSWELGNPQWTFVRPQYQGKTIVPYENEEFVVELTLRMQLQRYSAIYNSKQVIKGKWTLKVDEDDLFGNLSISNSGWPEEL